MTAWISGVRLISKLLEYRLSCSISSDIKLSKDIFEIKPYFCLIGCKNCTLDKDYTHILVPWGAVGSHAVPWGDMG